MCEIIKGLGGSAPAPDKLSTDPFHFENNIRKAVDAGAKLGVQPILTPKDMANPEVEHLGIMAYAAHLQWVPPRPPLSDLVNVYLESTSGRVGEPVGRGGIPLSLDRRRRQKLMLNIDFTRRPISASTYCRGTSV